MVFLAHGEREAARWSYADLAQRIGALALLLQSMGMQKRPVLLAYPPGLDFVAAFCACLCTGAIAVPAPLLAPGRAAARILAIVTECRPGLVLTVSSLVDHAELRQAFPNELSAIPWVATDSIGDVGIENWPQPVIDNQSLAFLQFTSGSTHAPRGVAISHANLLANLNMIRMAFEHDFETCMVSWLPLFHDMGLVGGVLQPLFLGGRTILMSPLDFIQKPIRWLHAISHYRATSSGGPNFAYDLCVSRVGPKQLAELDLSSWSVAFCGAEPVRADTLNRFASRFASVGFQSQALFPCYGLAEATLFVAGGPKGKGMRTINTSGKGKEGTAHTLVSCGSSWLDQQIAIVNPETGALAPPGQTGEIWVAGPHVGSGYWGNAGETAKVFNARIPEIDHIPFLRTGDLGFLQNGELFVTGRFKDIIIIRGIKYHPEDIEATVARSHPGLIGGGGAAIAITTEEGEQVVILQEIARRYLTSKDLLALAQAAFGAVCQEHGLRPYDLKLLRPGSLPRTSSNKIQRNQCKKDYQTGKIQSVALPAGASTLWLRPGQQRTAGEAVDPHPPVGDPLR